MCCFNPQIVKKKLQAQEKNQSGIQRDTVNIYLNNKARKGKKYSKALYICKFLKPKYTKRDFLLID